MSGFGERFRRDGYKVPKPLISIEGKPIIHHVIDMFPDETKFIFICNEDHLKNEFYDMRSTILDYCPTGKVVSIKPHKLGPVHAVLQVADLIDNEDQVVVNYCDFTCYWNWEDFKDFVKHSGVKGSVPAYRGFHPHSLGTTNYAYIKENNMMMQDIQEKEPYTDNRMHEYASSGTYYFSSGSLMLEAFQYTINNNLNTGNEFYVSLAYKYLLMNNDLVSIYPLQHFMQWGTPQDVDEYNEWSMVFKKIGNRHTSFTSDGYRVIPMAGLGKRFSDEGYLTSKPLIGVSGKKMVEQALESLPNTKNNIFVLRQDMKQSQEISNELKERFKGTSILMTSGLTEGQACTAQMGIKELNDEDGPIIFGACDNGAIYNEDALQDLLNTSYDLIVWGTRGYINAIRNPNSYGWIQLGANNNISLVSVKEPLSSKKNDPVVLGTFIFKDVKTCNSVIDSLIARNEKVNGEFYLDSCVNDAISMNLNVKFFEVDHFICWGTPNDLRTFKYWQSCFSKWKSHPYSLKSDNMIPVDKITEIESEYSDFE